MFTEPTVIIVGAGASVEFGLPSGEAVYQKFAEYCNRLVKSRFNFTEANSVLERLLRKVDYQNGLERLLIPPAQQINLQYNSSIDEYLYDNPSLYKVGKVFSAYEILRHYCSQKNTQKAYRTKSHLQNFVTVKNKRFKSWISTLTKVLTEGADTIADLKKTKLTIVTFNYDTMIEEAVLSMLRNTEKFSDIQSVDFLDILHVNGRFDVRPSYPDVVSSQSEIFRVTEYVNPKWENMIFENSKRIFMIKEPVSDEVASWRKLANERVSDANKIYSIGFACAPENVELIGLNKVLQYEFPPEFFALNYDGNIKLAKTFAELGSHQSAISGTASNPMGCSQAAELGFFSQ